MAYKPIALTIWDRQKGGLVDEFMVDSPATYAGLASAMVGIRSALRLADRRLAEHGLQRARNIEPFIRRHNIGMTEFKPVTYRNYAEFFDREFKEGFRPFPTEGVRMGAFGEAR